MTNVAVAGGRTAWRGRLGAEPRPAAQAVADARRALQLVLAGIWLLDAVLQYQSFMFTKAFSQMLAGTAAGNPAVIARPITWNASLVDAPPRRCSTRSSRRSSCCSGLASRSGRRSGSRSPPRSSGRWASGGSAKGLGGVLSGAASPLNGAPGAVIIYALLAVLLWPADRGTPAPFTAARAVGAHAARALWLVLWLSLAYFALTPANRAPQALSGMIAGMASGEPGWLAGSAEGRGVADRRPGAGRLDRAGGRAAC